MGRLALLAPAETSKQAAAPFVAFLLDAARPKVLFTFSLAGGPPALPLAVTTRRGIALGGLGARRRRTRPFHGGGAGEALALVLVDQLVVGHALLVLRCPLMPQLGLGIAAGVLGAWATFVLLSRPQRTASAAARA
jgi:hypothetical protein